MQLKDRSIWTLLSIRATFARARKEDIEKTRYSAIYSVTSLYRQVQSGSQASEKKRLLPLDLSNKQGDKDILDRDFEERDVKASVEEVAKGKVNYAAQGVVIGFDRLEVEFEVLPTH